ncbi:MAG: CCA tRNA nucleotidyltransferase [Alphaproteobacteria bacterium]|nr:CCA tRNA nucleotidyltransferase [Alphaproteobacteria bacterium]
MKFTFLKNKYLKKLFVLFEKYGEELYVVGGAVRDSLMDNPISDIDLATTMLPEKMMEMFEENNLRHDGPGIRFGTVRSFFANERFEITTLRQDKYEKIVKKKKKYISRYPKVTFVTDLKIDAYRRDFTINAIYVNKNGDVFDPFNGMEDLKNGVVKYIGNPLDSVEQDPFRILRYFRICAENFYKNFDEVALAVSIANFDKVFRINKRKFITEYNRLMACRGRFIILNKWEEYGILNQIQEHAAVCAEEVRIEDEKEKERENARRKKLLQQQEQQD